MLKLRDVSNSDLLGWFFVNDPSYYTTERSRELLEYEILALWDIDCDQAKIPDEERELPDISPYWLFRVELKRGEDELDALPEDRQQAWLNDYLKDIWMYRAMNHKAIAAKEMPPFPDPPPFRKKRTARTRA